jgi:hypothetical protein
LHEEAAERARVREKFWDERRCLEERLGRELLREENRSMHHRYQWGMPWWATDPAQEGGVVYPMRKEERPNEEFWRARAPFLRLSANRAHERLARRWRKAAECSVIQRRSTVMRLSREIDRLVNIGEMAIKKIYMRNPDREDAAVKDRFVETAERAMRALKSWDEEIERRLDLDYADERPSESGGNDSVRVGVEDGDDDRV